MIRSSGVRRRGAFRPSGERGAVTAETALAIPTVLLTAGAVIAGIGWAADVVRCHDAAGALARAVARGEDPADVEHLARMIVPRDARHRIDRGDSFVRVSVRSAGGAGPAAALLPDVDAAVQIPVEP